MRTAVVTLTTGPVFEAMAEVSHPTLKAYAERIGAEFVVLSDEDAARHSTPHWAKLKLGDLLNRYDRIIYLDTDILVREDCPDLTELVPFGELGAFDECPYTAGRAEALAQTCSEYGVAAEWDGMYFNSGVLVLSPLHKRLFTRPDHENSSFYEQSYLNAMRLQHGITLCPLDHKLNRMSCMDAATGEARHDAWILHYAGHPAPEAVPDIMRQDLQVWADNAPEHKYQRRIWVDVQGGLGDQVSAEPAIRFLSERVYPDDDIVVTAHWPRIFRHLERPGLRVGVHGAVPTTWDAAPWHAITLPGPETPAWRHVSNMMCHTVDYVSMALLQRTLPMVDRSIRLSVGLEDIGEVLDVVGIRSLTELTLVHAGKHWESKTFPAEWWQAVIDGLQEAGETVCLIGAESEDGKRGTVAVEVRDGMIDTRNRLSLGGLFALVGAAWCLVSNDSAPVHIAGAGDGWIIAVPTCKHEDHIMPYRNGSTWHKAIALRKDLMLDDCDNHPTVQGSTSVEFLPRSWDAYLPDPSTVVDAVKEAKAHDRRAESATGGPLPAGEPVSAS